MSSDRKPKPGRFPDALPACPEYDYMDPKTAPYAIAHLPEVYHPLDAWNTLGKVREGHISPLIFRYMFGAFTGFLTHYIHERMMKKKPWYAQMHKLFGLMAFGVGVAHVSWVMARSSARNRDAALKHYMETHYDDFPLVRKCHLTQLYQ